jgi:hypothetical protein
MSLHRFVAATLVAVLAQGSVPAAARQTPSQNGVLAGKATDEAKQPYSDYAIQLRDVGTGQVVSTKPLDTQGTFNFTALTLARAYLVELVQIKEKRIICTEGPYSLTLTNVSKLDVNVSCGKVPAAVWLLAAGAGAAAAVAVATRSNSR